MSILTAWVWIGIVMISMMSSTSITSMSGVVLMSTITSSSAAFVEVDRHHEPPARGAAVRLDDEGELGDASALAIDDDAADEFVARVLVGADMHLGLRVVAWRGP